MKRFFAILIVSVLVVSMCACGQKKGYSEEEQKIINGLYSLKESGESMQQMYDDLDEEDKALRVSITEVLYDANSREYESAMYLLKKTNVVIPDDLPETLPDFQK